MSDLWRNFAGRAQVPYARTDELQSGRLEALVEAARADEAQVRRVGRVQRGPGARPSQVLVEEEGFFDVRHAAV